MFELVPVLYTSQGWIYDFLRGEGALSRSGVITTWKNVGYIIYYKIILIANFLVLTANIVNYNLILVVSTSCRSPLQGSTLCLLYHRGLGQEVEMSGKVLINNIGC